MFWVYLALLGRVLLLGYEKIVVKQLSEGEESVSSAFLFFFIAALSLLPLIFFVPSPSSYGFLVQVAESSILYAIANIFYVRSLSIGEASFVAPLYNLNLLFLLVLTTVFLGEKLTVFKIGGVVLLIYEASLLGGERGIISSLKTLVYQKASLFMILASLFTAMGRTIDGGTVSGVDPMIYAFWINFGISIFLGTYMIITKKVYETVSLFKRKSQIATLSGFINSYSYLLLLFAFTKIDVSVAVPFSMLGTLVTVILARFIFGEEIRHRFFAALIMICGVWFLFL